MSAAAAAAVSSVCPAERFLQVLHDAALQQSTIVASSAYSLDPFAQREQRTSG
jgi:hypothetical protein